MDAKLSVTGDATESSEYTIKVRLAGKGDAATIDAIACLCNGSRGHGSKLSTVTEAHKFATYVADVFEATAGYVTFSETLCDGVVTILSFGVHPEQRRLGVGTQLIECVQSLAWINSAPCRCMVREDAYEATAMLRSCGFHFSHFDNGFFTIQWEHRRHV